MQLRDAMNPLDPDSRPTPVQEQLFRDQALSTTQVVEGGNQSGKSLAGSRTCAFFFKREHPYLDIATKWPNTVTILVLSQTSKHAEEHWEKRIKPFLEPGTYREVRQSQMLYSIVGCGPLAGKSKIYFFSYEEPKGCTKRIQSFDAELVWIDELCSYLPLYEEADRRVQAKDGLVLYTYTAKKPAPRVKKFIKSEFDDKKFYVFNAFDNPVYDEKKKKKIMDRLNALPIEVREKTKRAVLEGGWLDEEEYVYGIYDPVLHKKYPEGYSSSWRHAEVLDPAASGKVGYLLLAEDPNDQRGIWYIIKAKYIPGEAASTLLEEIEKETGCVSIHCRICDPHETWFIKEARKDRWQRNYISPNKKDRKNELIKGVTNAFLDQWLYLVPDGCEELEGEIETARWSETNPGAIHNSKMFHLLDGLQYFVDMKPKWTPQSEIMTFNMLLRAANNNRKKKEAKARKLKLVRASKYQSRLGIRVMRRTG